MDEQTRPFGLDEVLTLTLRRMVARRGLAGVYELLRFMTGQELLAAQLPVAAAHCAPVLVSRHPFLAEVAMPPGLDDVDVLAWLIEQERVHGATLEVAPATDWVRKDPIEALCDEYGAEKIYINPVDPQA